MTRRTTQKRAPLTRERVLRAALELADEGGTAALTMQRIGRETARIAAAAARTLYGAPAVPAGPAAAAMIDAAPATAPMIKAAPATAPVIKAAPATARKARGSR